MKTFQKFRQDLTEAFITIQQAREAYRQGVKDGTIGKCPKCGSPNLQAAIPPDPGFKECVDCGHVSDNWRITEDEGGAGAGAGSAPAGGNTAAGGPPTNNISGGNIAGFDPFLFQKKLKLVGPKPSDPEDFRYKIFRRPKPVR